MLIVYMGIRIVNRAVQPVKYLPDWLFGIYVISDVIESKVHHIAKAGYCTDVISYP